MGDEELDNSRPIGPDADDEAERPDRSRLSESEIKEAIEQSGYPLEVKLFQELTEKKLAPVLGIQLQLPNGKVKEIDLLTTSHRRVEFGGPAVEFSLRGVLGVKRIPPPDWFVGILPSVQPTPDEMLDARIQCIGGVPSKGRPEGCGEQSELASCLLGEKRFASAMHLLTQKPACVHWALAKRDGKKLKADGSQPVWEDLETTVMASHQLATRFTRAICEMWRESKARAAVTPHLHFMMPALVLDVPHLYVYDPMNGALSRADWFVLQKMIHVGDGRVVQATIDITSRSGFKELAMVHSVTRSRFEVAMQILAPRLADIAEKQTKEYSHTAE